MWIEDPEDMMTSHLETKLFRVVGFIDPRFSLGGVYSAKYKNGEVTLAADNGAALKLTSIEINCFSDGSDLVLWISNSGHFVGCEKNKYEEWNKKQKLENELNLERSLKVRQAHQAEAGSFNEDLSKKLPFSWHPAIKDVLSGLSESSLGDGRNRRTVVHIALAENIQSGRLEREAGEFLCSGSDKGKQWSGFRDETSIDSQGRKITSKVSCKACLKIAERLTKKNP